MVIKRISPHHANKSLPSARHNTLHWTSLSVSPSVHHPCFLKSHRGQAAPSIPPHILSAGYPVIVLSISLFSFCFPGLCAVSGVNKLRFAKWRRPRSFIRIFQLCPDRDTHALSRQLRPCQNGLRIEIRVPSKSRRAQARILRFTSPPFTFHQTFYLRRSENFICHPWAVAPPGPCILTL